MSFPSLDPLSQLGANPFASPQLLPAFQGGDLASLRCCGAQTPGLSGLPMQGLDPSSQLLANNNQMIGQMLQLLQMMLTGLMSNGGAAGSGSPADLMTQALGGASSPVNSASSSSAGGDAAQPAPSGGSVKSGSKVLVIGDSHTAGAFGDELDRLLRAKGANVHTVGSSGATADNYISGKGTTVGFADHKANGQTEKTSSHATPKLEDLINEDKPDTIIVNLGANFRGGGPGGIKKQVDEIGEIAKKHGIKITWVGPPTTREDQGNGGSSLKKFDEDMKAAVAPYGNYVSSAPFTPKYNGPDGVHYSGAEAKQWAAGVAGAV